MEFYFLKRFGTTVAKWSDHYRKKIHLSRPFMDFRPVPASSGTGHFFYDLCCFARAIACAILSPIDSSFCPPIAQLEQDEPHPEQPFVAPLIVL